jgi:outer membrane protein OmpA-like peptidoglycan-associated protein
MAAATPTSAQTVIGGSARPTVQVDNTVLDQLGQEPTLPGMLLGQLPFANVELVPPGHLQRLHGQVKPAETERIVLHRPAHAGRRCACHLGSERVRHVATEEKLPIRQAAATDLPLPASAEPETMPPVKLVPLHKVHHKPVAKVASAPAAVVAAAPKSTADQPAAPSADSRPDVQATAMELGPPSSTASTTPSSPAASPGAALTAPTPTETSPQPAAEQEAHLPAPTGDHPAAILFAKEDYRLSDQARSELRALAQKLSGDDSMEIGLLAYASGDDEHASRARKLSLSRALEVRSFLVDQGIRDSRIEVRALGNKVTNGPPDRVDLQLQKR